MYREAQFVLTSCLIAHISVLLVHEHLLQVITIISIYTLIYFMVSSAYAFLALNFL
jgi:hypothetical protein